MTYESILMGAFCTFKRYASNNHICDNSASIFYKTTKDNISMNKLMRTEIFVQYINWSNNYYLKQTILSITRMFLKQDLCHTSKVCAQFKGDNAMLAIFGCLLKFTLIGSQGLAN